MVEWDEILEAVGEAQTAAHDITRDQLMALWQRTDHPAQRCVLAHFLADAQDSVDSEVEWDEAAWRAFGEVRDADLEPIGVPAAAGFAPSLHLNLGDGYARLGRVEDARRELALAREAVAALADDGYGAMILRGLDGLEARLDGGSVGQCPDLTT
ncbi:hypothetical protein JNB_10759 [Janibacter sp. HTCC2649]|uniref:hypothetical protein n=1 Tax=Janibacter sp. HTCC2649 TaxID=313589 RepID=UPI0000670CFD|nr:hypothetical protein [Janibacter sp. HTCC2649]EAQ00649.1 hypothetical protein JNB_10759 [Janibacter sp. HTCC2649]